MSSFKQNLKVKIDGFIFLKMKKIIPKHCFKTKQNMEQYNTTLFFYPINLLSEH